MTMTNTEKVQRSIRLKFVKADAEANGIKVLDQFELGGRALVGERQFETVVWLESDGRWHTLAD